MNRIVGTLSTRQRAVAARLLAVALLLLISYSSTVESIHRHGGAQTAVLATVLSEDFVAAGQTFNDPTNEDGCLICQLHQQLVSGLVYAPLRAIAPPTELPTATFQVVSCLSATKTRQRGRAPPSDTLT